MPNVRPVAGSDTWHAHAVHGSTLCTMRTASSGFSRSVTSVPSSISSSGPGLPWPSAGERFHVDGMISW